MTIPFRFPTSTEWDKLCDICNNRNDILHWERMFTWCEDRAARKRPAFRVRRGCLSAHYCSDSLASNRGFGDFGFRPVFGALRPHALGFEDGAIVAVGTLYMNGIPVKAPIDPKENGDIQDYKPGAILEFREPLSYPDYQIKAIKVGNSHIADRCLLRKISWNDIADNM